MQFDEFLLDRWLEEKSGGSIRFDFGGSTGPLWRLRDLLHLEGEAAVERLLDLPIAYSRAAGAHKLRAAIADMAGVPSEHVIVMTGAAECLTHVFLHAAEPRGNVVVPFPGYPAYVALPKALGLEVRSYRLDRKTGFRHDLDEIESLVDDRTRVLLVNVPHNPTGAVLTDAELLRLQDLAARRGVQLVCDEVHSPVFHGAITASAARLPHVTTIGDFSKAFALPGLRLGWMIEPDRARAPPMATRENTSRSPIRR